MDFFFKVSLNTLKAVYPAKETCLHHLTVPTSSATLTPYLPGPRRHWSLCAPAFSTSVLGIGTSYSSRIVRMNSLLLPERIQMLCMCSELYLKCQAFRGKSAHMRL